MSFPFRVLAYAALAGAVLLAGFMYMPPLLRPGTPVSRFPELPRAVSDDLNRRGCNIVRGANVISDDFAGVGRRDWAVLCQQGKQASLLIYMAGSAGPEVFGTHGSGLGEDPESARGIRVVRQDYAARHNPGWAPGSLPRACIEDAAGMGSSIYCYLNGGWKQLAGAD